jgi:hypothetical protein
VNGQDSNGIAGPIDFNAEVREGGMRWLERYLTEGSPKVNHFAEIVAGLAERAD